MASLESALQQYGSEAYLFTMGEKGPHISPVSVGLDGARLKVVLGKTASGNIVANPAASVLWPALEPGGYSIIVNGDVTLDDREAALASIAITKSVFHRPGPAAGAAAPAGPVEPAR